MAGDEELVLRGFVHDDVVETIWHGLGAKGKPLILETIGKVFENSTFLAAWAKDGGQGKDEFFKAAQKIPHSLFPNPYRPSISAPPCMLTRNFVYYKEIEYVSTQFGIAFEYIPVSSTSIVEPPRDCRRVKSVGG